MNFTGHNIVLDDGSETLPGGLLLKDNGICRAALRALALCFDPDPWAEVHQPASVADLGCLEGGYSVEFARAGYEVTGIEARARNMDRCRAVAAGLSLPNLRFLQCDVRNLADYGQFDAVFCCGLLYHLDDPAAFLAMLGQVTRKLLIVQTHFSLTGHEVHEGRRGHWYGDHPAEEDAWGSHGNTRSFWLTRPHLLAAIRDAGFDLVLEQYDYLPDIAAGPTAELSPVLPCGGRDRGMFLGIKSGAQ